LKGKERDYFPAIMYFYSYISYRYTKQLKQQEGYMTLEDKDLNKLSGEEMNMVTGGTEPGSGIIEGEKTSKKLIPSPEYLKGKKGGNG
jgi:hypothetical protein